MASGPIDLRMGALRRAYQAGMTSPSDLVKHIHSRLGDADQSAVWISTATEENLLARARELESLSERISDLPLYGIPFSVKDNIDVEGEDTTAACPGFAYRAERSATVVERALAAGAIYVGKTNLDQFATGLVGVRSPYGIPVNPFNADYIPGGSSSGAAVSVATGVVSFAFGTDTGGSGRIPASYNGLVGFKPAPGDWSRHGLVFACRSFDTPSVFTNGLEDALTVDGAVRGPDRLDPYSTDFNRRHEGTPRVAVLQPDLAKDLCEPEILGLFQEACDAISTLFPSLTPADLSSFQALNDLMFFGPLLAERDVSVGAFIDAQPDACQPIVASLVQSSRKFTAADAYRALYRIRDTQGETAGFWQKFDVMITPTVSSFITLAMCEDDPLGPNFRNGTFTNFANPLGLAAIAVPFGHSEAGVPWGLTLYSPPERVPAMIQIAAALEQRGHATDLHLMSASES